MTSDDSFFNSDDTEHTIILKPTPGKASPGRQQPESPAPQNPTRPQPSSAPPRSLYEPIDEAISFPKSQTSSNVLNDEAAKLLVLIGQLKNTPQHNDVEGLHRQTIEAIQSFENNARSRGVNPELVLAARYALCATIDETVLNTPWGSNSLWSYQSMLSTFHQETSGGEKFFMILDRIRQQPGQNLELLELMFTCLSFGFEGKYRLVDNGRSQLESLRDDIYRTIRQYRGEVERDLSPRWSGVQLKTPILHQIPLWVIAAFTAAILVSIYAGFNYMLYQESAPVIEKFDSLHPESSPQVTDS